jgi:poly(A) polymerase Pap1
VIYKFFEVYSSWRWIDPVFLKIGKKKDKLNINALLVIESLTNEEMPIMVPSSSPMNSAYRVCKSTFSTLCNELIRARGILR